MARTTVVVIGAGQAGLAVSHLLTASSVDHVVLERGRVGERWRSQRWDSLRLLSPSWLTRLPGWAYTGPDPEGYLAAREVADHLSSYALHSRAPVFTGTEVLSVRRTEDGYAVHTSEGLWLSDAVVIATGWCDTAARPAVAAALHPSVHQVDADTYRRPDDLPQGGVLVVGGSATGVQLADEIAASGRRVVLAVGNHTRVPRRHRGRDVFWWLDAVGLLRRRREDAPPSALREPSLQLVGRADGHEVDLPALQRRGVVLAGRFLGVSGRRALLAPDLPLTTAAADARMHALLDRFDAFAVREGLDRPQEPVRLPAARTDGAPTEVVLGRRGIRTVVWATGYRRPYGWLQVPVLDARGEIVQTAGRTPARGLYVVGLAWQTRRNSMTIDGVGADAATVVGHLHADLGMGVAVR